jgi:hypothetical protein
MEACIDMVEAADMGVMVDMLTTLGWTKLWESEPGDSSSSEPNSFSSFSKYSSLRDCCEL